jgi:hypothetical protein
VPADAGSMAASALPRALACSLLPLSARTSRSEGFPLELHCYHGFWRKLAAVSNLVMGED